MSNLIHFFAQYPYHIHFVQPKLVFTPSGQLQSRQELHLWDPWSLLLTSDICLKWGAAIWKVTRTTYLVKENNFWQAQATNWYLSWSICVHFIPNKCFHLSNSISSRLLLTSDICLKWGAATTGPKDEAPGGSGVDQRGWKRVLVGQNVCGKGIVQKKWIKLLISGRNGNSNFLHPPIGGRHRLLYFRTNIKATNMKEIQQGNLLYTLEIGLLHVKYVLKCFF